MYVCVSVSLCASMAQAKIGNHRPPPSSPSLQILPPPSTSLLLLIPLYISQSGLKIDENLLWDYVLRAANNVEEPPGLSLPKQRSNKTRSWEIHGYLIETEASELLCYIYRQPFCFSFFASCACLPCLPTRQPPWRRPGTCCSLLPTASHATATNTLCLQRQ